MELKICHLYSDLLSSNGDEGNILCLSRRCLWRGIQVSVTRLSSCDGVSLSDYDIVYIGGSQDFPVDKLSARLEGGDAAIIHAAAENGVCFLAICAGFIIMCKNFRNEAGKEYEMVGALDCRTAETKQRITGNCMFLMGDERIVGFENHSVRAYPNEGSKALGKMLHGGGNNGNDGYEGLQHENVFASWCHGPLLPQNPKFCDMILENALRRKYGAVVLAPLDDSAENLAHDKMVERLSK